MLAFIIISFSLKYPIFLAGLTTDQYLTHYWSILNETMTDLVGNAHMQQGSATTFTSDRFGCPNSALNLNGGYTYVPVGVYFDAPEFTISVWIYSQSVGIWSRVIDFGSGSPNNNIVLSQDSSSNLCPAFQIFRGTSVPAPKAQSLTALVLSRWQFLTATFDGSRMSIYINGVLTGSISLVYSLSSFTRTNNYVGKSFNSPPSGTRTDGYSYSYLDDLRFYNKSLNQSEILKIMSLNSMIFFLLSF